MSKKILAVVLAVVLVLTSFAACGNSNNTETENTLKIGVILIGDENEGYTYAHIAGIKEAAKTLGIADSNILWKYTVPEDQTCHDAAVDLVENGCELIFSNSYGHQDFMKAAAMEHPEVTFVAMTGDTAKKSELPNFCNAFTSVYESRYVSGVVAGMKIAELVADGKLTDANYEDGKVKVGYVGAHPYAEVVSGYTAFYLGIKSVYPDVVMKVSYTSSWFDIVKEGEAANAFLADGCVIIGQHADSTGAPAAVEAAAKNGTVAYSVGYNVDMLAVAPTVALTSATNNWSVYYTEAIKSFMDGNGVPTNWSKGYSEDAVGITDLGPACAEGTAEKVAEVEAVLKEGTLHVFDTSTFTVDGAEVTSAYATDSDGDWVNDADEAVFDGYYHESYFQSAPSFSLRIDGIVEE